MTTSLFPFILVPALTNPGLISPSAKLAFYLTNTTTLATVYDADGDPISQAANINGVVGVEADAFGRFPTIYCDDAVTYRARLRTKLGVQIGDDIDPYQSDYGKIVGQLSPSSGAGTIGFSQDQNYAVGTLGAHAKNEVWLTDKPYITALSGSDYTAVIAAALADLDTRGGGTLLLPPGTFRYTDFASSKSRIFVRGSGRGATILRPQGWVDGIRFANGYPSPSSILTDVGVADLTIDCTDQTAGANDTNGNGVNFNSCDNFLCENVEVLAVKQQGIVSTYFSVAGSVPKGGVIRDNYVDLTSSTNIAIGVEGNAQRTIVSGNRVQMATGYGIYSGNVGGSGVAGNLVVSDNVVTSDTTNTGVGIFISDGTKKAVVSDNAVNGLSIGIRCGVVGTNHSFNYTVTGNTVNEYDAFGIIIGPMVAGDKSQAVVSGNVVTSTAPTGPDNAGIASSGGAFITGNIVDHGTGAQGIKCAGTNEVVRNNTLMGTSGFAVEAATSTGCIIADNTNYLDINPAADTIRFGNLGFTAERWNTYYMGGARFVPNPNGASAPVSGTWATNDIVWNSGFASSGYIGYCCTAGGTPGTWKGFGVIA